MLTREILEKREKEFFAPYAVCSADSAGREYRESPCEFRTAFERDHDRIVHSDAFRRLEYKTQVFVNHEGDYYRTRLTHTLEVAQMSRGIARTLRLNEYLAEAIALCHDLGHTPFGHSGESALNSVMKKHGGFEHNLQSYRVVTLLEHRYPEFPGLNLSKEVLEGVIKHTSDFDHPKWMKSKDPTFPPLEGQLVNVADEIAYMNHDLDDGLESELITLDQLEDVKLWCEIFHPIKKKFPKESPKIWKYQVIRLLIHDLLRDVKYETLAQIKRHNIGSVGDIKKKKLALVNFSTTMQPKVLELKGFLLDELYCHYRVERMAEKARKILEKLFDAYNNNPKILPTNIQHRMKSSKDSIERTVCDYIAGMTDRFALDEYKKLFDPHEKV